MGKYDKWTYRNKYGPYTGVRSAEWGDFKGIDDLDILNMDDIIGCIERSEFLIFEYSGLDRLVAPFVLGVSSRGKPLFRGYQVEGKSKGGAGYGWRVFQVREMSLVNRAWEFFNIEDFKFNEKYPWIYKVFKTASMGG